MKGMTMEETMIDLLAVRADIEFQLDEAIKRKNKKDIKEIKRQLKAADIEIRNLRKRIEDEE